jgi:hypothetical protein
LLLQALLLPARMSRVLLLLQQLQRGTLLQQPC